MEHQVVFNVYGVHVVIIDDVGNKHLVMMRKINVIMEYIGIIIIKKKKRNSFVF